MEPQEMQSAQEGAGRKHFGHTGWCCVTDGTCFLVNPNYPEARKDYLLNVVSQSINILPIKNNLL